MSERLSGSCCNHAKQEQHHSRPNIGHFVITTAERSMKRAHTSGLALMLKRNGTFTLCVIQADAIGNAGANAIQIKEWAAPQFGTSRLHPQLRY